MFRIIEKNVRVPVKVLGDFRAQVASLDTGEAGVRDLVSRYGAETLRRYWTELLDFSERATRHAISGLPDGVYAYTDYLDSDGIEVRPVPIKARLTIDGDRIIADFTGSSPQVQGSINSTLSMTKAATYFAVRSVLQAEIPNNAGFFRPFEVIAEEGSILNSVLPAASGGRGVTLFRLADTVLGALAQAVPDRVFAAGEGGPTLYSFGGHDDGNDQPFVLVEMHGSTWGGRPDRDGLDGVAHPLLNQRNIPVESMEVEYPLRVLRYGFLPDTGGAGKYRGGLSLVRDLQYVGTAPATLQIRSDRRTTLPYGLAGGEPGAPSINVLNPGTQAERPLPAMATTTVDSNAVIRFATPGGGGWGDPLERDAAAVAEDVRDGKTTPEYACRHHRVVVDAAGRIDSDATMALRTQGDNKPPGTQE